MFIDFTEGDQPSEDMDDCCVLGLWIDTLSGNYEKMTIIKGLYVTAAPVQSHSPFQNSSSGTERASLGPEAAKKENSYLFGVIVPIRNVG